MGSITYPYLSTYFRSFSVLFGKLTGYLVISDGVFVAVNGTAALVVEAPADSVKVPFVGNTVPASVVRALDQLPKINTVSVENLGDRQWLTAVCDGGIGVDFSLPLSGSKVLTLAHRLRKVATQDAVEELGTRKLAEFSNGWQFGEVSFLKPVIKPVLEAMKVVHPLAPRSTLVESDITLGSGLVSTKPVPVLRLGVVGYGKVKALVLPATRSD